MAVKTVADAIREGLQEAMSFRESHAANRWADGDGRADNTPERCLLSGTCPLRCTTGQFPRVATFRLVTAPVFGPSPATPATTARDTPVIPSTMKADIRLIDCSLSNRDATAGRVLWPSRSRSAARVGEQLENLDHPDLRSVPGREFAQQSRCSEAWPSHLRDDIQLRSQKRRSSGLKLTRRGAPAPPRKIVTLRRSRSQGIKRRDVMKA